MNSGIYYQVLVNLAKGSTSYNYDSYLKELIRKSEISNVEELFQFLGSELISVEVNDAKSASYFTLLAEMSLLFFLYRRDYDNFQQAKDIIDRRMVNFNGFSNQGYQKSEWTAYFEFIALASLRLMRKMSAEVFEEEVELMDWDEFSDSFIPRLSGLIGHVYTNESNADHRMKGKFWLQKAANEAENGLGLLYNVDLANYYFASEEANIEEQVQLIANRLAEMANSTGDLAATKLIKVAEFEVKTRIALHKVQPPVGKPIKFELVLDSVKELEYDMKRESREGRMPQFTRVFMMKTFGEKYFEFMLRPDFEEKEHFCKQWWEIPSTALQILPLS